MDLNKFVESLPDNVKSMLASALIRTSIAMKNVEEDILKPDPSQLQSGFKKEFKKSSSRLLESMRNGEYNAEYVKYFYEVLKRADAIVENSTAEQLMLLSEKYGMGQTNKNSFNFLNEYNTVQNGGKTISERKNDSMKNIGTRDDKYDIEKIISNKRSILNEIEYSLGAKPQYKFTISIRRNNDILNKIEEITEVVHIKEIQSQTNGRIVEFFIPKKFKLKSFGDNTLIMHEMKNNGEYLSFQDKYGEYSEYRLNNFYKISEIDQYDVIKYNATKIENVGFIR